MKKNIATALAVLAGISLTSAYAQSRVTLYGIMDSGLTRISNIDGGGSSQLRSGNYYSSRFGFRGSEDLGGGLKANFQLEAGLAIDTGATSTPFFNRQSWVGLSSANFGEITMGRVLPVISDIFAASLQSTHFGPAAAGFDGSGVGAGSAIARFNNMLGGVRVNNAIKYQSPNFSGFRAHAMAALGEVTGAASAGRTLSMAGSYTSDSIEAGLGYHERECLDAAGCVPGKDKDKIVGLGAAYKLDGARYAMIYTRQKNALNVQGNDADVLTLLARVPFGPWIVGGGLEFMNDKSSLNQDARQLNIGVNYLLSKRTQLYGLYMHQTVKNGGKAGMYSTTSSIGTQSQISIGIAHTF